MTPHSDPLVDKGVRLFTYLAKTQQLREKPVIDIKGYEREGQVVWLHALPEGDELKWGNGGKDLLTIHRPERTPPPQSEFLRPWLDGDVTDARSEPILREKATVNDEVHELSDWPDVRDIYAEWLDDWRAWAAEDRRRSTIQLAYDGLFQAFVETTQNPEDREFVVALGLLSWAPESQTAPIRRHVFTQQATIRLKQNSGALAVSADDSALGFRAELDMVAQELLPTRQLQPHTEEQAAGLDGSPLDAGTVREAAVGFMHNLHPRGQYSDSQEPASPGPEPLMTWAPALILRPRRKRGLSLALARIAELIAENQRVPSGLETLLDPDRVPPAQPDPSPGAVLLADGDAFAPLPLNEVQRRVIDQVDRNSQTLVQGPPGTGKTHMAAALLSHLLAQGKRVLVTAHTDQALKEVRGKLPEQIRPLAVSVIGTSRDELAELRVAVETIARRAGEHDVQRTTSEIRELQDRSVRLAHVRRDLVSRLVAARAEEAQVREVAGLRGTPAELIEAVQTKHDRFAWAAEYADLAAPSQGSPDRTLALEWLNGVRSLGESPQVDALIEAGVDVTALPPVADLARAAEHLSTAQEAVATAPSAGGPTAYPLPALDLGQLDAVRAALVDAMEQLGRARAAMEDWQWDALGDLLAGRNQRWNSLREETVQTLRQLDQIDRAAINARVETNGERGALLAMAESLLGHLRSGGQIKLDPSGAVRTGVFTSATVKKCLPFFSGVRVDDRLPVTELAISTFLAHDSTTRHLDRLSELWQPVTLWAGPGPLVHRIGAVEERRGRLDHVFRVAEDLASVTAPLRQLLLPPVNLLDYGQASAYLAAVDVARATAARDVAAQGVQAVRNGVAAVVGDRAELRVRNVQPDHWSHRLLDAAEQADVAAYAQASREADEARATAARIRHVRAMTNRLAEVSMQLVHAVLADPWATSWDERLGQLDAARQWVAVRYHVAGYKVEDINGLRQELSDVEDELRGVAERIAAKRAWNHALAPDQLTPSARSDLKQYAQLVTKLGKGTGKFADARRRAIRESLDRCTGSVPVWIMPLYRVIEQLTLAEDLFDVVLIDEASQAGLEATFLQFLAPRIVVIGDDQQVSPTVFADEQAHRDLARQLLPDFRYRDTWQDPNRSLFDEAVMRYGSQLTLTEHRRCMPEIIRFSNEISYEPNGMTLVPVRQFGADRLDPFRVVHVRDGVQDGNTNHSEARALVDQLKRCLEDPAYDGMTFGVISLLGHDQPKLIERMLMAELDSAVWEERDLRVGSPAEFQGSERDVIFLTMVTAPGTRTTALTKDTSTQRYNVAVSRAKDQVWLFHSIGMDDLKNKEDVRYRLLAYAYDVQAGANELRIEPTAPASETEQDPRFATLFEQRVHNRIVQRGFTVVPQHEVLGHRIDLMVVGASACLAVECEGREWSGPQEYAAELARQRELERCGWVFFRVTESVFTADPDGALEGLWPLLEELEIKTAEEQAQAQRFSEPDELLAYPDEEPQLEDAPARGESAPDPAQEPEHEAPVPTEITLKDMVAELPSARGALRPYVEFTGWTRPVAEATLEEITQGLMEIVRVEGPVTGERLTKAYVASTGGRRGSLVTTQLKSGLRRAVRKGLVIEEKLRSTSGFTYNTFRLPEQPSVLLRDLGPRDLAEVPSREIVALLNKVVDEMRPESDEEVLRAALRLYGRKSITEPVRAVLEPALQALRAELAEEVTAGWGEG